MATDPQSTTPPPKINPNLSGPQETLLGILESRAIDARAAHPVLGDAHAVRILSRLDYDFRKLGVTSTKAAVLALRARCLDRWAANFLREARRRREPVTVLHLAAGLDTRALRLQEQLPPPGSGKEDDDNDDGGGAGPSEVLWVDADLPDVVAVRRRLEIPAPETGGPRGMRYELKAADVTDENWLARLGLPRDRRTFVIFEGLTMYLPPEQGRAFMQALTSYFVAEGNEMAFDCVSWLLVAMHKLEPIVRNTNSSFQWYIDDPKELEQLHEGLRLRETILPVDNPGNADLPALPRWLLWIVSWIPLLRTVTHYARLEW